MQPTEKFQHLSFIKAKLKKKKKEEKNSITEVRSMMKTGSLLTTY